VSVHGQNVFSKKVVPSAKKKQQQLCSGIVKASCYVNFFHQKQQILRNSQKVVESYTTEVVTRMITTGVRHIHDGALTNTSAQTAALFQKQKWEVLHHQLHSPHLAS
jgi:hypothetical protein